MVCEVCGNDYVSDHSVCPYCGHKEIGRKQDRAQVFLHRIVNLEIGRPVAEVALNNMTSAIEDGKRNSVTLITFIHGYGSSGKGGVIKKECRNSLDYLRSKSTIRDYILGEEYTKSSQKVKLLIKRYPELLKDPNLGKGNRGITLVVL